MSINEPVESVVFKVKPVTGFYDGGALTPCTSIETRVCGTIAVNSAICISNKSVTSPLVKRQVVWATNPN